MAVCLPVCLTARFSFCHYSTTDLGFSSAGSQTLDPCLAIVLPAIRKSLVLQEKDKGTLICWIYDTEPNKVQASEVLIP